MKPEKKNKLLELEGLRGLAALCVVFGHLQGAFFKSEFNHYLVGVALLPWPLNVVVNGLSEAPFNGRFAVWVFWALSGFALSYRFFAARESAGDSKSRSYLLDAALRRYPRLLLPVLVATFFTYVLMKAGLMANQAAAQQIAASGPTNAWLADAFSFKPGFWDALVSGFWSTFFSSHVLPYYDPPLWTMKRELLGSFFIFVFLAVFGRVPWRWFLYLLCGTAFIAVHQIWVGAFLAGIILCDLHVNNFPPLKKTSVFSSQGMRLLRENVLLAAGGAFLLAVVDGHFDRQADVGIDLDPHADLTYIFLAFAAIVWVQFSSPIKRLLSSRPLAFLGQISFGIYISHLPFIMSFATHLYVWLAPDLGNFASACVTVTLSFPCIIGVGTLFYWIADRPSLSFSKFVAAQALHLLGGLNRRLSTFVDRKSEPAQGVPSSDSSGSSFGPAAETYLVPPRSE